MLGRYDGISAGLRARTAIVFAVLAALSGPGTTAVGQTRPAETVQMQLRLAWGGATRRAWQGRITIDSGQLSGIRPLGLEADEPGSMWLQDGAVVIRQAGPRIYDGLDLEAAGPAGAVLVIALSPVERDGPTEPFRVPLAELFHQGTHRVLDDEGNQLSISRGPGDRLQVELDRDSLVFAPGEEWTLRVHPRLPDLPAGTLLEITSRLQAARGGAVEWSQANKFKVGDGKDSQDEAGLRLTVPLPNRDGVYELKLTAGRVRFNRLVPVQPVAERLVQLVVLSAEQQSVASEGGGQWELVEQFDPSSPSWWTRLLRWPQLSRIPGWPRGPLGSSPTESIKTPLGDMVRMQPAAGQASWQAYPLPIRSPGKPHLLEVEYPGDAAQQLDISILEPNSAGHVWPVCLDSGLYGASVPAASSTVARHRLVFWPKTKTPLLLLVNRRGDHDAIFGKVRVLACGDRLPRPVAIHVGGRLFGGYYDRPVFPENFSATDVLDKGIGQNIDDWVTFYEGTSRLVDYMHYAGMNALMLTVLADGSTIYPSKRLDATPRYDTGILATTGQDPIRKDVLELVFRFFDREGLKLVPALQFATRLPELEAERRGGQAGTTGIEWVGRDGRTWSQSNKPRQGLAPYYNPLHPRVQEAMLGVVRELATRYGHHRSFAGVALQLTSHGYAQLVGPQWGMDDHTIAHFEADTGLHLAEAGADRFEKRYAVLADQQHAAWLDWRAGQLASFYHRIHAVLAGARPEAKLYLAATTLFEHPDLQAQLRPTLPRRAAVVPALVDLGIQPDLYQKDDIALLRPNLWAPPKPLSARSVDIEVNRDVQLDRQLGAATTPGALQFHRPQRLRLASFDEKSPFGKDHTYTLLLSQPLPSAEANRRRFAHSLAALDARAIFDGGFTLPMGQEASLRDWIAVFGQIPADDFRPQTVSRQPVTIRALTQKDTTWIYVVNDSPWSVDVTIPLDASKDASMKVLGNDSHPEPVQRDGARAVWKTTLAPYDLAAAQFSAAKLAKRDPDVRFDPSVTESLSARIRDLGERAASLPNQPPSPGPENADFEAPAGADTVAGWQLVGGARAPDPGAETQNAGAVIDQRIFHTDPEKGYKGKQSVRLVGQQNTVSLRSRPFAVPQTGRVALRLWLRTEQLKDQPLVALGVEGPGHDGELPFRRVAWVGGNRPGIAPLKPGWAEYYTRFDDLAINPGSELRIRIDLVGPGTVWIDDIQLNQLSFQEKERKGLYKIIVSAGEKLQNGELSACLNILEGYWPQFLVEHVPPVSSPYSQAGPPRKDDGKKPAKDKESPGLSRRLRGLVPRFLRF